MKWRNKRRNSGRRLLSFQVKHAHLESYVCNGQIPCVRAPLCTWGYTWGPMKVPVQSLLSHSSPQLPLPECWVGGWPQGGRGLQIGFCILWEDCGQVCQACGALPHRLRKCLFSLPQTPLLFGYPISKILRMLITYFQLCYKGNISTWDILVSNHLTQLVYLPSPCLFLEGCFIS